MALRAMRTAAASVEWLIVALQLGAVALLVGLPDLNLAGQYFGDHVPSTRATLALAGLCVWIAALLLAVAWIVAGMRRWRARRSAPRHAGSLALLLGVSLLAFGLVHSLTAAQYSQCCGTLQSARQLVSGPEP
jgi:hypothetical protein